MLFRSAPFRLLGSPPPGPPWPNFGPFFLFFKKICFLIYFFSKNTPPRMDPPAPRGSGGLWREVRAAALAVWNKDGRVNTGRTGTAQASPQCDIENRSPDCSGPCCATASICSMAKHVWHDRIAARFTTPGHVLTARPHKSSAERIFVDRT